ncbi:hypothetical protein B5E48_13025 [Massilimicrobiota sp. An105]|uniref:hypothetical protein n=1 Tax=Massilimicrobiota sp. An105 TaxID=1965540 RepID=UPI000B38EA30|nr:hypothetical protein [Massilimicrobiota sp. An105]OUQ74277.1 hypothetical protein B5E48_13025 [Massilimicrobiota sp. An105]
MKAFKKIFLSMICLVITIGCAFATNVYALEKTSLQNDDIIEPQANKKVIFDFEGIYVSVEHRDVDLQLYGYIDDVSGKLINVAGVHWYNNTAVGYYNKDSMEIAETTRIDTYTIRVKMLYTYKDIFGTVLSKHYFTVTCDSPGPSGSDLV